MTERNYLKNTSIFRRILGLFVTGICSALVLWVVAWLFLPDVSGKNQIVYTPEEIQAAEKARDVSFDPDNLPVLHVKVDYSEGAKARWYPKGESPILAKLVKEGKLPPVAERVGPEPCVMKGCDGTGKYGGTWLRIATNPGGDIGIITWRMSAATAMRWSPLGYPIVPHVLKSLESRNGNREFILTLRKGMRWSDGHPLTADDIMYWWNHEFNDEVVYGAMPDWMKAGYMTIAGERGTVERTGDFSVKFSFPAPHALFTGIITRNTLPIFAFPAHYLKQYHPNPKIGDKELCEKAMKAYKLPSRSALYTYMKHYQNPEHPRLWPWIYRTYKPTPPQVFVRNPYYFVVDTEGNQLPYVDRVQFDVKSDDKMLALAATEGRITMQTRHINYDNYTELMSRRKTGGYRVLHWYSADRGTYIIQPNQNRLVDPDRPDTKKKAKLLADRRFRQALSLAINRRRIIKAEANNQTEPSQAGPGPESIFYHKGLVKAFTQYDPERANRILDEIGLDQRDSEGFRTFPDGTRMVFYHDTADRRRAGTTEFVIADWLKVGMRIIPRERSRRLFYVRKDSREFDFNVWGAAVEHMAVYSPRYFIPLDTESFYAVG